MKHLLLTLMGMILCLFCNAQQLDTTTFEGKSKYIFQHVDKSHIWAPGYP